MEGNARDIRLYAGNSNRELAEAIASSMGQELGHATVEKFPDGEVFVQYKDSLRNADVFIIQSTCTPTNENLMELLIMIDAARRASAARITAVIPYYGYARQDSKDRPRVPITSKLVANLLTTAGVDRVLTMDLHAQQIQGFFDIPVDHLYASPVLIPYMKSKMDAESVVVSPDSGSVKMAQKFADRLGCGFAVVAKRRVDAVHVASSHLVGDVKGRTCLIVDDMTSTAGTLCAAAELLKNEGAGTIYASVSHFVASEKAVDRLANSCIEELITTDSVPCKFDFGDKVKVLSVAKLLAEAIRRIHEGGTLTTLFS